MFWASHGRRGLGNTTRINSSLQIVSVTISALPNFTKHAAPSTRIVCPLRGTFMHKAPTLQGCYAAGWTHISIRSTPPLVSMNSVSGEKVHRYNSADGATTEPIPHCGWPCSLRRLKVGLLKSMASCTSLKLTY
jgi:hypothetical protein